MKNYLTVYTHTHTRNTFFFLKCVLLFLFYLPVENMFAQVREPINENPKFEIRIDSQFIKGTPYEIIARGDDEYHLDKDVEYYTDATIYEYTPIQYNEQGALLEESSLLPTIFLLSGGGFVSLDNQPDLDPGNPIEGWRYAIVDQIGSTIKEGRIFAKNDQISIESIPNGLYNFILYGQNLANSSFVVIR